MASYARTVGKVLDHTVRPRAATGKIDKARLRADYAGGDIARPIHQPVRPRQAEILRAVKGLA
jgi:hypothetical protein